MSTLQAFVTIGTKKYRVELTKLTIEILKQQIIEVSTHDQQGNVLVKVTDGNECDIETEQQLQKCVECGQLDFKAYFQGKTNEQLRSPSLYEMKYPLVLLAGALKYEQRSYLKSVMQDLHLLQSLFQTNFGYQVFSTCNIQNPNVESLTLKDLIDFISDHVDVASDCNHNNMYDGLIFVWCGHGEFGSNGPNVITSDNKTKDIKDIQHEIDIKTGYFEKKPKICMVICDEQENGKQDESNHGIQIDQQKDTNVLTIFANTLQKPNIDNLENQNEKRCSYFTQVFCHTLQSNMNTSLNVVIQQVANAILGPLFEKGLAKMALSKEFDICLIPKTCDNDINDKLSQLTDNAIETLDFKRHWDRYWRKANMEAAKVVEQMMKDNERGLILVFNDGHLSSLLNYKQIEKKQIGHYFLYVIKGNVITLDEVSVDGNAYVINCRLQCKRNVCITTQLFVTKNTIVDQKLELSIPSPIQWNTKMHYDIPAQLQDLECEEEKCSEKCLFNTSLLHLQKYLKICADTFGLDHPYVAIAYNLLAITYNDKGEYDTAIQFFEKALDIALKIFGVNYAFVAQLYHNLGISYQCKGDEGSIECYEKSLKIRMETFKNANRDIGDSCWNLAIVFNGKGEKEKAYKYYEEAWKRYSALLGECHEETLAAKIRAKELNEELHEHNESSF
ncbi:hypothetical protein RFI_25345 [Reticulomyxa filosa]|uniref:Uncharacterized protein n=1 Tax=Reticulomyxa filosa TaxID=46433 RepID=X6MG52_RETFI|nr:hypothetical protein RFI_25345 [Reticulomyxa filosa]|eukprot:ETO12030.1 hypothetical protein RFI_25345 [Reticulomyxa filosa]